VELKNKFLKSTGANRAVPAFSNVRITDAIGNGILFILIPIHVAKLPSEILHLNLPVPVGPLISLYGIISSTVQPVSGDSAINWITARE